MIVYRKHRLWVAEYWDSEEPQLAKFDLVRCFQQSQPREGMLSREFYTVLLDLNQKTEQLLAGCKRDTRYEIRRAERDNDLTYEFCDGSARTAFREFSDFYDRFAIHKSQPKLDRAWLSLLAESGALVLSRVLDSNGETLVWHAYHRSSHRVTLFYSASLFREFDRSIVRNKIGRANRYLHWRDMCRFQTEGVATYDLGGWYQGASDPERLKINRFKEEFGGQVVKNFICEQAVTLKAKAFLQVRRLLLGDAI